MQIIKITIAYIYKVDCEMLSIVKWYEILLSTLTPKRPMVQKILLQKLPSSLMIF